MTKEQQYHKWCKIRSRLINRYTNDQWWPRTLEQKEKAQNLLYKLNEWIELHLDVFTTTVYIDFATKKAYSRQKTHEDRLMKLEQANQRRII